LESVSLVTAVLHLPELHRKRLRTTNGAERPNEEIRWYRKSGMRLLGAVQMEIEENFGPNPFMRLSFCFINDL
jgi:hypothetical protein